MPSAVLPAEADETGCASVRALRMPWLKDLQLLHYDCRRHHGLFMLPVHSTCPSGLCI